MTALRIVEKKPSDENERPATQQEIKRALQVLIGAFPNSGKADLMIYAVALCDDVIAAAPSVRSLNAACHRLRRESNFVPTIAAVLSALATAAPARVPRTVAHALGPPGDLLLRRLGSDLFWSWFRGVTVAAESGDTLTLIAPSKFIAARIKRDYEDGVLAAWRESAPSVSRLEVRCG
jgi:hypothetical protein